MYIYIRINLNFIKMPLYVNGLYSNTGATIAAIGSTTATSAPLYIAPASTGFSGANNYFFTYLATPITSGSTTGTASTLYIAGAPSGATTAYSLNVAAGNSNFGGAISASGIVATSNATSASSTTTGALKSAGGLGVVENAYIGGTLNVTGNANINGSVDILGAGGTTISSGTLYIAPASTALTGANNYYFTYLATPTTTGSTSGTASTLYIDGPPSGATTSYTIHAANGISRFGGGNSKGYVLLNEGATDRTGYISFVKPNNVRAGYIGWGLGNGSSESFNITAEQGGLVINGTTYIYSSLITTNITVTNLDVTRLVIYNAEIGTANITTTNQASRTYSFLVKKTWSNGAPGNMTILTANASGGSGAVYGIISSAGTAGVYSGFGDYQDFYINYNGSSYTQSINGANRRFYNLGGGAYQIGGNGTNVIYANSGAASGTVAIRMDVVAGGTCNWQIFTSTN